MHMQSVNPLSLLAVASWNDRAAKRSDKLKDKKAAARQRANAANLRAAARNMKEA